MITISDNLKAALRKNANASLIINISVSIALALLGCVTIVAGLVLGLPGVGLVLPGVILLALGVGGAWYSWKTRVDVVALLEEHPERIVWVYKRISTSAALGIIPVRVVVFGLDDKRRFAVRLPARDADRLLEELQVQLPHATIGYSAELEGRYGKNPQDLRRS